MNELVKIKRDKVFTDSLVIAGGTNNKHHAIQQIVKRYKNDFEYFGKVSFQMRPLKSGQSAKVYLLNEEQATLLMTYLRNSEMVRKFKKELVQQFYEMREFLREKASVSYKEIQSTERQIRRLETDTIKEFVEYAKNQGSRNAERYYTNITKLANKIIGIEDKALADSLQLANLVMVENIIANIIRAGIDTETHYKDIYSACKERLETVSDLMLLGKGA